MTKLVELTSGSSTESDLDALDMNMTVTPAFNSKATEMNIEIATEPYIDLANFSNETALKMPTTKSMAFDIGSESMLEPVYSDMEWAEPDYDDYDEMAWNQPSTKTLGSENWSKNVSKPKISQGDLSVEDLDAVDDAVDEFFLNLLIMANNGSKSQHCLINQNSKNTS